MLPEIRRTCWCMWHVRLVSCDWYGCCRHHVKSGKKSCPVFAVTVTPSRRPILVEFNQFVELLRTHMTGFLFVSDSSWPRVLFGLSSTSGASCPVLVQVLVQFIRFDSHLYSAFESTLNSSIVSYRISRINTLTPIRPQIALQWESQP